MVYKRKKLFQLTAAVLAAALFLQTAGCSAAAKYLNAEVSSGLAELSSSPSVQFDPSPSPAPSSASASSRASSGTAAVTSRKSGVQTVKRSRRMRGIPAGSTKILQKAESVPRAIPSSASAADIRV